MLTKTFQNLIGQAIVASGRAIKVFNINLFLKKGFDITPEQFVVLNVLNEHDSLCQSELGKLLFKDKSNMTRILSVLEEKGLLEKVQSTENKKQVNKIQITKTGKILREKILPTMDFSHKKYLKNITEDEIYTCIKVLSKIKANLESEE